MNSFLIISLGFIVLTVLAYEGAKKINKVFPHPLTLPILLASIFLILFLLLFDVPYRTYMAGGKWIDQLLGPAVVALAFPLYKQRTMLKTYLFSIIVGVFTGSVIGISSGFLLAYLAGFTQQITYSIIPKSVTTPVAIGVIDSIGGIPALTAVFVIFAGIIGAVLQRSIFNWFKLNHFLGRGVGMGTASHAIGTAKSMEASEKEGTVSTIAMTLSAIFMSVLAPVFVFFFI